MSAGDEQRCKCGHLASKHNDLGYCQVRRFTHECGCDNYDDGRADLRHEAERVRVGIDQEDSNQP